VAAPPFIVELRDRDFKLLNRLEHEIERIDWGYSRVGGCDSFRIVLNRKFDEFGALSVDYDVQVRVRNKTTGDYDLWYRGYLEGRQPVLEERERVTADGFGYVAQLQRVYVSKTYTSTEISVIVTDILDTFVTPNTKIVKNASKIAATSETPDSLKFQNVTAAEAIRTCAEIAGTREWGVDRTRDFFFQARSTTVKKRYISARDVLKFSLLDSFGNIFNRVLLEGGDVSGTKFTRTINDTASQDKYGLREIVITNHAITTNAVADAYGAAIMAEKKNVQRRGSVEIHNVDELFEDTTPLGTVILKGILGGTLWGTKKWGTFLWGGEFAYQINTIRYSFDKAGYLSMKLDIGQVRPDLLEFLREMGVSLDQVRAART